MRTVVRFRPRARVASLAPLLALLLSCAGGDGETTSAASTTTTTDSATTEDVASAGTDESSTSSTTAGADVTTDATTAGATSETGAGCAIPPNERLDLVAENLDSNCGFTTTHYGRVATDNVRECLDPACNTCLGGELFPLDILPAGALTEGMCVLFEHHTAVAPPPADCETRALVLWEAPGDGAPRLLAGTEHGAPAAVTEAGLPALEIAMVAPRDCACAGDVEDGCCGDALTRYDLELTPDGGAPVTIASDASAPLSLGDQSYTAHVTVAHASTSCDETLDFVTWFLVQP